MTSVPQSRQPATRRDHEPATAASVATCQPAAPSADEPVGFAALVTAHQHMVWRYLRLLGADDHEADDLLQDTFIRLAQSLEQDVPVHAPAAYLRGIARNLLIGARRRQRSQAPTLAWADAVDELAQQPQALDDSRIEALRRCVARLEGRARQVVHWHHIDGMPYSEAARRLGIGEHGIKSLLGRTRAALRACIEQQLQTGDEA